MDQGGGQENALPDNSVSAKKREKKEKKKCSDCDETQTSNPF